MVAAVEIVAAVVPVQVDDVRMLPQCAGREADVVDGAELGVGDDDDEVGPNRVDEGERVAVIGEGGVDAAGTFDDPELDRVRPDELVGEVGDGERR